MRTMIHTWTGFCALFLVACASNKGPAAASVQRGAGTVLSDMSADAVLYQYASAEVHYLYLQSYALARLKLDRNLSAPRQKPPAVIVDVDETVLDNSRYEVTNVALGRTYTPENWAEWSAMEEADPLPGAVSFLRYADSIGCAVFYITNRSLEECPSTLSNLRRLGFPQTEEDHVLCKEGGSDKTERRRAVAEAHEIVLLCGDQLRDMDERFKDRSVEHGKGMVTAMRDSLERYFVLFPNAMYGTWRDAIMERGTDAEKLGRVRRFFKDNAY
ncbi:MAG: 5'-nucleotidase, lipoprotein e(P4) family [Flavobacteriales bacterium]|nr:5'-nucleotidase, lipoprotein e(P4) family [Flavobacteriales bacterium]